MSSRASWTPLDAIVTPDFKARFIDTFLTPSVHGRQDLRPADRRLGPCDVLQQGRLREGRHRREPPATWADLKAAARRSRRAAADVFAFGLQGKEIETDVYFYYGMWSYGGEIVKDGKSGLDSRRAIDAAKLYKGFIDAGYTQPGVTSYSREDVQNLFKQGKVATVITAPFLSNQIKAEAPKLNYGVAPIPAGPTRRPGTYGVTDSIVLFKNSKNKDEAWKFLDFLFTTEQRTKFDKVEGFLPVNKPRRPRTRSSPTMPI